MLARPRLIRTLSTSSRLYANAAPPERSARTLDVDGAVGEESLRALVGEHGQLSAAWVRTGSGGRHAYFALPADQTVPSSVGRLGRGLQPPRDDWLGLKFCDSCPQPSPRRDLHPRPPQRCRRPQLARRVNPAETDYLWIRA
jgi:Bifunctional DNA primase/polymerase, N-terminal